MTAASAETQGLELAADSYEAARGAHAAVVMTTWPEFRSIDFDRLCAAMARPVLVDAHNFLNREAVVAAGLAYFGVGIAEPKLRVAKKAAP